MEHMERSSGTIVRWMARLLHVENFKLGKTVCKKLASSEDQPGQVSKGKSNPGQVTFPPGCFDQWVVVILSQLTVSKRRLGCRESRCPATSISKQQNHRIQETRTILSLPVLGLRVIWTMINYDKFISHFFLSLFSLSATSEHFPCHRSNLAPGVCSDR